MLTPPQTRALLFTLTRMVGPNEAPDILQAAYLKVLRTADTAPYDGSAQWSTWFGTIARRMALDYLRAYKHRPLGPSGMAFPDDPDHYADLALSTTPDWDSRLDLLTLARRLRPLYRQVVLAYLQHGHYATAAQDLGIPLGTFKTRLMWARKRLSYLARTRPGQRRPQKKS